jgi:non-ribosomal peptide synthetase-like protein
VHSPQQQQQQQQQQQAQQVTIIRAPAVAGSNQQQQQQAPKSDYGYCVPLLQLIGIAVGALVSTAGIFPGVYFLVYDSDIDFVAADQVGGLRDQFRRRGGHRGGRGTRLSPNATLTTVAPDSIAELNWSFILEFTCIVTATYPLVVTFCVWALQNLLLGDSTARNYRLSSSTFAARWLTQHLIASDSANVTKALQGTVYLPWWFRLMGGRIGSQCEISSPPTTVCADRLTMDAGAFLADSIVANLPVVSGGLVSHGYCTVGKRAFVGNGALMQHDVQLADNSLVGLQSLAPPVTRPGETFVGSPPLRIGMRQTDAPSTLVSKTYSPGFCLITTRYVVELLGYALLVGYQGAVLAGTVAAVDITYSYWWENEPWYFLLCLPVIRIAGGIVACLLVILTKWIMIGRYRAGSYPLYSTMVWRTELVERLEENFAEPMLVHALAGTIYAKWFYVAMGAQIGKRPYLDRPIITEQDLVKIGDYATIEHGGTLQAHLFQDRVRTTDRIVVGDNCSIGVDSVVLLGGRMGNRSVLHSLSAVMRHEEIPAGTDWHGVPAVPHVDNDSHALQNQSGRPPPLFSNHV